MKQPSTINQALRRRIRKLLAAFPETRARNMAARERALRRRRARNKVAKQSRKLNR